MTASERALQARLGGATLPSSPTAKTGQTVVRAIGGTMRFAAKLFAALLMLFAAPAASAQSNYPNRPVKILVGFTPGTAPDLAARMLADRFAEVFGSPFVVENMPGAGSNIATDYVAKAAPDGYTLLMGGNSSLVINPSLYETLPFDPVKDFEPVSQVFIAANVLAVPSGQPVKSVAELVALAKAEPGKLSYGHAGVGTSQHLGAELFKYMAHVDITPVPYRGTTALMPDLLANRVSMAFANIVNVLPLAREGKLRALAITSIKRQASRRTCRPWRNPDFPASRPCRGSACSRHQARRRMCSINCISKPSKPWRCRRYARSLTNLVSSRSATRRLSSPR
jgi:tripartite-type tricarboxylate transporter receptor subunit TctC